MPLAPAPPLCYKYMHAALLPSDVLSFTIRLFNEQQIHGKQSSCLLAPLAPTPTPPTGRPLKGPHGMQRQQRNSVYCRLCRRRGSFEPHSELYARWGGLDVGL